MRDGVATEMTRQLVAERGFFFTRTFGTAMPSSAAGLVLACLVAFAPGCAGSRGAASSTEEGRAAKDTEIEHEDCDLEGSSAEKIDANGDGRADITVVREGNREVCRAVDLNFDGLIDRFTYRDESGQIRRLESDYDRDGQIDEIALLKGGIVVEKQRATTLDRRLDTWHFYEGGKVVRTERDSNGDAVIDQWWEYPTAGCPLIHSDVNNDGRPDPGATIDYCKETGYVPPAPQVPPPPTAETRFDRKSQSVEELEDRPAEGNPEAAPAGEAKGSNDATPAGEKSGGESTEQGGGQ